MAIEYRGKVWDANYRIWESYAAPHGAQLDLFNCTSNDESTAYPVARWLRNSLRGARYTPGTKTVYLTVPDTMRDYYNREVYELEVDMLSPEDAAKLYAMAQTVMGMDVDHDVKATLV